MKNILCILGLHRAADDVFIRETRVRGKHKYRATYCVCRRCLKKMHRVTWRDKP